MRSEIGNAAAMREAFLALYAWAKTVKENPKDKTAIECAEFVEQTAKEAIKKPPRNCDVGTAEEQAQIYDKFCEGMDCVKCPVHALWHHYFEICKNKKVSCGLIWAQMPYEEGGAE